MFTKLLLSVQQRQTDVNMTAPWLDFKSYNGCYSRSITLSTGKVSGISNSKFQFVTNDGDSRFDFCGVQVSRCSNSHLYQSILLTPICHPSTILCKARSQMHIILYCVVVASTFQNLTHGFKLTAGRFAHNLIVKKTSIWSSSKPEPTAPTKMSKNKVKIELSEVAYDVVRPSGFILEGLCHIL